MGLLAGTIAVMHRERAVGDAVSTTAAMFREGRAKTTAKLPGGRYALTRQGDGYMYDTDLILECVVSVMCSWHKT
jgi:hypothetical protein